MDTSMIVQAIIGTGSALILWYIQFSFKQYQKGIEETQRKTDEKIDRLTDKIGNVVDDIHSLKDELVQRVSDNKLENEKLNTEVVRQNERIDSLQTQINELKDDNKEIRRIIDRRGENERI